MYDRRDALFAIHYHLGRASFGIGLGERRGQGLGADAARLTLRRAFEVLGLHNVMLETADWNAAAIRAYERAGFAEIGRRRGGMTVAGRRCDAVLMDAVAT